MPDEIGAGRLAALKQLRAQREALAQTTLPPALAQIRDQWLEGQERPGAQPPG